MQDIRENERQRALLIALDTGEYDVEVSLAELAELADTAGADTVGTMVQKRDAPDAATCIGSGRIAEAAGLPVESVLSDALFKLAGELSLEALSHSCS